MKYVTAPSYAGMAWDGEPFSNNGKMYVIIKDRCERCGGVGRIQCFGHIDGGVCYKCNGHGTFTKTVRVYDEKEIAAQKAAEERKEARRLKALEDASESNRHAWLTKNGFNDDGSTFVVAGGDTFIIKDMLKDAGCKFNMSLKWHTPIQFDLPDGYHFIEYKFDDLYTWDMYTKTAPEKENVAERVAKDLESAMPVINSEYMGEVGERLRNLTVVLKGIRCFESRYGFSQCVTFQCGENMLTWFTTATIEAEIGDTVQLCGTVKSHDEYKNVKTTVLTRCKIKEI